MPRIVRHWEFGSGIPPQHEKNRVIAHTVEGPNFLVVFNEQNLARQASAVNREFPKASCRFCGEYRARQEKTEMAVPSQIVLDGLVRNDGRNIRLDSANPLVRTKDSEIAAMLLDGLRVLLREVTPFDPWRISAYIARWWDRTSHESISEDRTPNAIPALVV